MNKGYIQIYTGDGKGKTTAALGLVLRACGAKLRVFMMQFIKCGRYCEVMSLRKHFPEVTLKQCGRGCFIRGKPSKADIDSAAKGLALLRKALLGGKYDLVIADEINSAVAAGLLTESDVLRLMAEKPDHVELVLTGRSASKKVIAGADLVTEMREIKHYYRKGVAARLGIEK